MTEKSAEISLKLARVRQWLRTMNAGALRLRGTDWFAWATAGGSNTVLLTAETGVAEILVTPTDAYVLTDEIEALRLREEEIGDSYAWHVVPWADLAQRDRFIADVSGGMTIVSDRPAPGETPLPPTFAEQRYALTESERKRYRQVGRLAAEAMTEVLRAARPDWTEYQLAGAGAEALWVRGLHPALTLAAGARRLPRYRHSTPSADRLGARAMLVFCARGQGLYANLTRFVEFGRVTMQREWQALREIEAEGLAACRAGAMLSEVYAALADAYRSHGYPEAIRQHHQGGITGYLAREVVATPHTMVKLDNGMAVAFNPSLPGVKLEDTLLLTPRGHENLTVDPAWPAVAHGGLQRALPLEAA
ncbi:MAG: M24 family metallopeptidase [Burkholderiaceae bacterium]